MEQYEIETNINTTSLEYVTANKSDGYDSNVSLTQSQLVKELSHIDKSLSKLDKSISKLDKNTSKLFCSNCSKQGHVIRNCIEPIASYGIFCFKLDDNIKDRFNKNLSNIKYYDLDNNYNINISNILKFNKYNKIIQFLLVKRKHSLNYIDFIRGKYDINENLLTLFNYMSASEIEKIKTHNFNFLWNELWKNTANNKQYSHEKDTSEKKFNELINNNVMKQILQQCCPYDTPEWEIPKGRKDYNESNINCAIREFKEETSFDGNDYNILDCINPIHDIFIGTNNKLYKHVFYIGLSNNTDIKPIISNNEIDEIRWCNWEEAINLIRPYNENKITLLTNIFLFIVNICEL